MECPTKLTIERFFVLFKTVTYLLWQRDVMIKYSRNECFARGDLISKSARSFMLVRGSIIVKKGMNEIQFGKQLSYDWQLSMHVDNANKIYVTQNANFP